MLLHPRPVARARVSIHPSPHPPYPTLSYYPPDTKRSTELQDEPPPTPLVPNPKTPPFGTRKIGVLYGVTSLERVPLQTSTPHHRGPIFLSFFLQGIWMMRVRVTFTLRLPLPLHPTSPYPVHVLPSYVGWDTRGGGIIRGT